MKRSIAIAAGAAALALGASGCSIFKRASTQEGTGPLRPYPEARWRLARGELRHVVLFVSHILVMHEHSGGGFSSLRAPEWSPDPKPTRSVDEALRIARDIQRRAAAAPEKFAELARQHSDDSTSRERGGSLGGLTADQLPNQFLDALAAMQAGDVSEVVQTALGYHVILRRAVPPREEVSGAHIEILYAGTYGATAPARSREDALKLARSIVARSRAGETFEDLAAEFSEAADRVRHGDLGTVVTTEPDGEPGIVESLAALAPGDVSDPIDTAWGFEILRRTDVRPRSEFAMRAVWLPYDPEAPESEASSVTSISERAAQITRDLKSGATSFQSYAETYCCKDVKRWLDGHGDPVLTTAVENLSIGEITATPIRIGNRFMVAQRLDPSILSPPKRPAYELPTPTGVDIEELLRINQSEGLVSAAKELRDGVAKLPLSDTEKNAIREALGGFERGLPEDHTPEARVARYHSALTSLHKALPEATYAHVVDAIRQWASAKALGT